MTTKQNLEKLQQLGRRLSQLAEQAEKVRAAYQRLSTDRGVSVTLDLGAYWKVELAQQNAPTRGMDMIVLGVKKELSAQAGELRDEILAVRGEIEKLMVEDKE